VSSRQICTYVTWQYQQTEQYKQTLIYWHWICILIDAKYYTLFGHFGISLHSKILQHSMHCQISMPSRYWQECCRGSSVDRQKQQALSKLLHTMQYYVLLEICISSEWPAGMLSADNIQSECISMIPLL